MNWRGRGADPAVTRRWLVEAACQEIAEKGIGGASIDAIAARAGLTKGAVYSTCGSRAELLFAVADAMPHPSAELDVDAVVRQDWELVGAQLAAAADVAPDQVFLLLELMAQAARDSGLHMRVARRLGESIERVVQVAAPALGLDSGAAEQLATQLHAQLVGLWAMRALLGPKRIPDEMFARMLRSLLIPAGQS